MSNEADRTSAGRLFQSRGPAVANDRSPTVTHRDGRTSRRLEVILQISSSGVMFYHQHVPELSTYFLFCRPLALFSSILNCRRIPVFFSNRHSSLRYQKFSGDASAVKEPGHFEVRKLFSQVTRMHFFSQKSWRPFLSCRPQNTGRQRRFTVKIKQRKRSDMVTFFLFTLLPKQSNTQG